MFTARPLAGDPTPSDESSSVQWVDVEKVADYPMHRSMRLRIEHFASGATRAVRTSLTSRCGPGTGDSGRAIPSLNPNKPEVPNHENAVPRSASGTSLTTASRSNASRPVRHPKTRYTLPRATIATTSLR